jgi:hypothetical protein
MTLAVFSDLIGRVAQPTIDLAQAIVSAFTGGASGGSRVRIDAVLDNEYRLAVPVLGIGDITYGTLETLDPPCSAVTVGYSSSPIQIAGDVVGRGPLLLNEDFATDTDWTKGSNWTITGGAAVAATATSDLSQASGAKLNGRVLIVFKMTNTSGTVTPYAGTTAGTARGSAGVTNKVYAEVLQVVGSSTIKLTGAAYLGSVDWLRAFPLCAPQETSQESPRSFSRIAAVCYAGVPVDVSITSGHGVWPQWLRV